MRWVGVAFWVAVAVWWACPPVSRAPQRWQARPSHRRSATPAWSWGTVGVVVTTILVIGSGAAALVIAGAVGVGTVAWVVRQRLRARQAGRDRVAVAHACSALSAEVVAGRSPVVALREVAREWPVMAEGAAHVVMGGDPAALWRTAAQRPGMDGLAELAATWEVCVVTGAPMGPNLDRLAESLQQDREVRSLVNQELAAARATGRLMAGLPVIGLLLGYAMGGDPVGFLVSSLWGQICLVVGVTLACGGVLWTERMADRAGAW